MGENWEFSPTVWSFSFIFYSHFLTIYVYIFRKKAFAFFKFLLQTVEHLARLGAPLDRQNVDGNTALLGNVIFLTKVSKYLEATLHGHERAVSVLLNHGADISIKNRQNVSLKFYQLAMNQAPARKHSSYTSAYFSTVQLTWLRFKTSPVSVRVCSLICGSKLFTMVLWVRKTRKFYYWLHRKKEIGNGVFSEYTDFSLFTRDLSKLPLIPSNN